MSYSLFESLRLIYVSRQGMKNLEMDDADIDKHFEKRFVFSDLRSFALFNSCSIHIH